MAKDRSKKRKKRKIITHGKDFLHLLPTFVCLETLDREASNGRIVTQPFSPATRHPSIFKNFNSEKNTLKVKFGTTWYTATIVAQGGEKIILYFIIIVF